MWSLDDFETIRELGAGCSSVVYLMRHTREDTLVAAKRIQLEYDENNENSLAGEVQAAKREAAILQTLIHPNIVSYYASFCDQQSFYYLLLEFMDAGDLSHWIDSTRRRGMIVPEQVILSVLRQCAQGLQCIHSHSFIHRDIKPQNIYLNSKGEVKIGDFGVAERVPFATNQPCTVGTLRYMAPEVVRGETYDQSADIWSLGCVICELMNRRPLISEEEDSKVISSICELTNPVHPFFPGLYSNILCQLVGSMLSTHKESRPDINTILSHPILAKQLSPSNLIQEYCERMALEMAVQSLSSTAFSTESVLVEYTTIWTKFQKDYDFRVRNAQGLMAIYQQLALNKHEDS